VYCQHDKPLSFARHAGVSEKPEILVTRGTERVSDRNMKIITIANQKGGTAKTTTTAAIGVLLSRREYRVHLIDADPQASLSQAFGVSDSEDRFACSLVDGEELPVDMLDKNLSLTPGSVALATCEAQLLTTHGREYFLRTCLEKTQLPEDTIVLVDSPPSLGVLALNCLAAAGGLIVTVQPGGFEIRALAYLETTVHVIQKQVNPDLAVLGIILTNCHRRRRITRQTGEEVAQLHGVLGSIRADARMLYATTGGRILHLRRSNALEDYADVVDRLEEQLR
jgi:chromosome partitioning protein